MKHSAWILGANFQIVKTTAETNLAQEFSNGLIDAGFDPMIIPLNRQSTPVEPEQISGSYYRLIHLPLLDSVRLPLIHWVRGAVAIWVIAFRLLFSKNRPKLIFCMTVWWWAAFAIAILGKCFRVKTIYYLVEEPSAVARMQFENRDNGWVSYQLKLIQSKLVYFAFRFFDIACCMVPPLGERAIQNGINPKRVWVMPNIRYLDSSGKNDALQNADIADGNSIPRILYTGRINYTRDEFETLLEAAKLAKGELGENPEFLIEIYGSGPAKDRQRIDKIIDENSLEDIVIMKGFLTKDKLVHVQKDATAFLLLKADIEQNLYNFPTKLMDYLSNSRPVIMTRIKNHTDHFTDELNCLFVDAKDPLGLLHAIRRCIKEPKLATQIGAAGNSVLKEKFNATLEVRSLLNFAGLISEQ